MKHQFIRVSKSMTKLGPLTILSYRPSVLDRGFAAMKKLTRLGRQPHCHMTPQRNFLIWFK